MTQTTSFSPILTYLTLLLLLSPTRLISARPFKSLRLNDEERKWALDYTWNFTGKIHPVEFFNHSNKNYEDSSPQSLGFFAGFQPASKYTVAPTSNGIHILKSYRSEQPYYLLSDELFTWNTPSAYKKLLRHEVAHAKIWQTGTKKMEEHLNQVNFFFDRNSIVKYGAHLLTAPPYFSNTEKSKFKLVLTKDLKSIKAYIAKKTNFMVLEKKLHAAGYAAHGNQVKRSLAEIQANQPHLIRFTNQPLDGTQIGSYKDPDTGELRNILAIRTSESFPTTAFFIEVNTSLAQDFLKHVKLIHRLAFKVTDSKFILSESYIKRAQSSCNEEIPTHFLNDARVLFPPTEKQKLHDNCIDNKLGQEIAAKILELPEAIQQSFFKHTLAYLHEYLNSSPDSDASPNSPTLNHNEL